MLDTVLNQVDRLKMHAQDLNAEIDTQAKRLKRVNGRAERARDNLE